MSDYQQGYDDGRSQHYSNQATQQVMASMGSLIVAVVALGSRLLVALALASPFLVVGFLVATPFDFLGTQYSLGRLLVVGASGYLSFAALYWLKGVGVALAKRGGWLWLLPLGLCIGIACIMPALLVKQFIAHSFPTAGLWSWGLALAFGLFAYNRYQFTRDTAPASALWSYRRGFLWGGN
jgi:hypothetical protein